jgi:guanyl-specific ribonuclease Sa
MPLQCRRVTLAGVLGFALVATWCATGCSRSAPDAIEETDLTHHKKTHAQQTEESPEPATHGRNEENREPKRSGESREEVAEKARTVLKYIDEHHEAPKGYEGGRTFHNFGGAQEETLPKHDSSGRAITYQEWDVNPKVAGVNRGTERLITGSDGSAYVTADHYKTFMKVR